ncbi:hypothetical protein [Sphingomonas asaccharolytica]|uniref:hypothetical protein n=1 Tax=Sphingomonas asaccharolytica TaxID=40681 RepID=UPI0012ED3793|nr:hypothetical protein [Sphingomonas asaccharolytica]
MGDGLKEQIVKALHFDDRKDDLGFADPTVAAAIRRHLGHDAYIGSVAMDEVASAAGSICRGLNLGASIDNYLHTHQGNEILVSLAKAAIAICIIRAEAGSGLFEPSSWIMPTESRRRKVAAPTTNTEAVKASWYLPLAQHLFNGVQIVDLDSLFDNVRFIIFNYDRCLEQFLFMAVQEYFDIDDETAAGVLERAQFIHPYGSLGTLPWRGYGSPNTLPYGTNDEVDWWKIGSNLRTFTESVRSQVSSRIQEGVSTADSILFLGFGFLEQNVNLLVPYGDRMASTIISTAYKVEADDRQRIKDLLRLFAREDDPNLLIEPGTCRDLFDHYRITLNFA